MGKRRRYDIVFEGASWTVAVGGPSLRGFLTRSDAIAAARETARKARAEGQEVEIYLWEGSDPVLIEEAGTDPDKKNPTVRE